MGLQVQVSGSLVAGPASISDAQFPAGSLNIPLALSCTPKAYAVATGNVVNVQSPSSFEAIPGIGAGGIVTLGSTLYVKTSQQVLMQLTNANPAGGAALVSVIPVVGLQVMEFPSNGSLTGLAFEGSGTIEYWVGGSQ